MAMVKVGTITASYMWESVNYQGVYSIEHEPKHDPSPELAEAWDFIVRTVG